MTIDRILLVVKRLRKIVSQDLFEKKKIARSIISCCKRTILGYCRIYIKEAVGSLGSSICHPWAVLQASELSKQKTMAAA